MIPPWGPGGSPEGGGGYEPPANYQECPPGQVWKPQVGKCVPSPAGGGGGQDPNNMPCPPGRCKDVVSGVCRQFNPNREKVNMTDEWERESGGGRGYCRKLDGGGGGGGGGGQGSGGHKAPGPAGAGKPGAGGAGAAFNGINPNLMNIGQDVDSAIAGFVKGAIGGQTRYTPEIMQEILAAKKAETEGQVSASTDELNSDLARRGIYRSPVGASEAAGIRREGDRAFGAASSQLRIDKAKTDFEDKLAAVDRGQAYLNSLRTYVAQLDVTQSEREKLKATIELGYARLDQEMQMLLKQLASNKELLGMSINSQQKLAQMAMQNSNWQFLLNQAYGGA